MFYLTKNKYVFDACRVKYLGQYKATISAKTEKKFNTNNLFLMLIEIFRPTSLPEGHRS